MKYIGKIVLCAALVLLLNACSRDIQVDKKAEDAIRCRVLTEIVVSTAKANPNDFASELENLEIALNAFEIIELKYSKEHQVDEASMHDIEKKYFKEYAGKSFKELLIECGAEFHDDLSKIVN